MLKFSTRDLLLSPLISFFERSLTALRAPKRRSVRQLNCVEALEMRCLLAANLTAILDQGQLTITDSDATGSDNSLVVTVVGTNLVISDASEQFIAAPAGGSLSNGDKTLTIPLNLVTTTLTINGAGGNDTIEVNSLGDSFGFDLAINGNDGTDTVNLQTGPIVTSANINVTVDIINVNTPVTAAGQINLISTGDETLLAINAPISMGGTSRFISDKMAINASVDALLAHLTLAPENTADVFDFINIGSVADTANNTLELSDAELDRITAGFITIGNRSTGTFTISSSIEHIGDDSFLLETARNVIFNSGSGWSTHNGDLTINANNPVSPNQGFIGIDLNQATLESSGAGNITLQAIAGSGGTGNTGIHAHDGTRIESTGTGRILVSAGGGVGTSDNRGVEFSGVGTVVTSTTGEILINGRGGVGGDRNIGVWLRSGATVSSTGTAKITIEGTGNRGVNENNGVVFNAYGNPGATRVTTVDGHIEIIGHGPDIATGSGNRGIGMYEGSLIQSTGLGKISLDGTGGDGSDSARGVELAHDGTSILSATGDIQITGKGGDNSSGFGVWMVLGAAIQSTGTAKITIEGTGGDAYDGDGVVLAGDGYGTGIYSVNGNISIVGHGGNAVASGYTRGVIIATGSVVQSTGVATITINGTGGDGVDSSRGIEIADAGTRVTSAAGNIHITGVGGNNTAGHGVWMRNGATVESTGTANITIEGTGGNGEHDSRGIEFGDAGTRIQAVSGDIEITGHGGNGGYQNHGIYAYGGAVIQSIGTGDVTLTGIGGTGDSSSRGVQLNDVGTAVNAVSGDIRIDGQGGDVTGPYSMGVWMVLGSTVSSSGSGSITIEGTSGSGVDENSGVLLNGFGFGGPTRVTSVDGDISIIGNASSETTGARNRGIGLFEGAVVESTGLAKIRLDGHGGTGTDAAMGVELRHEGTRITSGTGDIHITGRGGANTSAYGIWMLNSAAIESTGTAKVTIEGFGGNANNGRGICFEGSARVSSVDGAIAITGQGGDFATGDSSHGLVILTGTIVESTGTASITLNGIGGDNTGGARGTEIADIGTSIRSVTGDITITGQGGSRNYGIGVWLRSGAVVESTGLAKIGIHGTAGIGESAAGVLVNGYGTNAATRVVSANGDISIVGSAAGATTGSQSRGVGIYEGGIIESTGLAKITIDATAGNGTYGERGFEIADAGSRISSKRGDILINGYGGTASVSTETFNTGVWIRSHAVIESTATEGVAAKITINGTGGVGSHADIGVFVSANSRISSHIGDITIKGKGADGAGFYNYGINIQSGSSVESSGTAKIALTGTGGNGAGYSIGVIVDKSARVLSSNGEMQITGQGGLGGEVNIGIAVQTGAFLESTGTGSINIDGTGGQGTTSNYGFRIADADSYVRSTNGDIQIVGVGGTGSTTYNAGISIAQGSRVSATGMGDVVVTGTGGSGVYGGDFQAGQVGVWVLDAGSTISSKDGDITVTGIGGGGAIGSDANHGVKLQGGVIQTSGTGDVEVLGHAGNGAFSFGIDIEGDTEGGTGSAGINTSAGTGNITLITNSLDIDTTVRPGQVDAGAQTVTIHPETIQFPINIGGSDNSSSLGLTNTELNQVTAGTLVIGSDNSGTLSFSNDLVRQVPTDVQLVSGGDILIDDGYVNTQSGSLFLNPGPAPYAIKPLNVSDDIWANPIVLGGDLAIAINGPIVNSQYDQLSAYGIVNLNGQALVLTGSYVPLLGDTFTVVDNSANQPIIGTFNGLAEGATLLFNGRILQITYLGGAGHDVVLTRLNAAPNVAEATLSVTEDTPTTGTLTATDIDGPSLTYSIVAGASHGTVTITDAATGAYTYIPNAEYSDPDSFTFKVNDGIVDSNIATVTISVAEVNDTPQLNLNGDAVTFSAKAARKGGPVSIVPNVTVVDPDQSAAFGIGGGTLTVSIDVSAKVTRKSVKFNDTIGGLSNASSLGTSTGPTYTGGKLVLTVALNANTTTAAIQNFLRGLTFKTKGPGIKQAQRNFQSQLTDAAGASSIILRQTIFVTK